VIRDGVSSSQRVSIKSFGSRIITEKMYTLIYDNKISEQKNWLSTTPLTSILDGVELHVLAALLPVPIV
jgi:hypothetical protein